MRTRAIDVNFLPEVGTNEYAYSMPCRTFLFENAKDVLALMKMECGSFINRMKGLTKAEN